MKILAYRYESNFNFEALLYALSKTKYEIGYLKGEIPEKAISDFAPDIIIHNIPDVTTFPIYNKAVSININETNADNSFPLKDKESKNYIKPFVSLKRSYPSESDIQKYSSDVMYIGSPSIFSDVLKFLTEPSNNILFKFFTNTPHNINGYCGICNAEDYFKFYHYAKASLVEENDTTRILDIIVSDGNPIVFNKLNTEECIEKIKSSVEKGTKYTIDGLTTEDIISKDTAFDRMSKIFKTVGLNKIAEEISKQKSGSW